MMAANANTLSQRPRPGILGIGPNDVAIPAHRYRRDASDRG
jgi:hypothetical protein